MSNKLIGASFNSRLAQFGSLFFTFQTAVRLCWCSFVGQNLKSSAKIWWNEVFCLYFRCSSFLFFQISSHLDGKRSVNLKSFSRGRRKVTLVSFLHVSVLAFLIPIVRPKDKSCDRFNPGASVKSSVFKQKASLWISGGYLRPCESTAVCLEAPRPGRVSSLRSDVSAVTLPVGGINQPHPDSQNSLVSSSHPSFHPLTRLFVPSSAVSKHLKSDSAGDKTLNSLFFFFNGRDKQETCRGSRSRQKAKNNKTKALYLQF